MTTTTNIISKKEISSLIEQLFDSDLENIDSEKFNLVPYKDFYKEVLKQKKARGWRSKIKIPCNWITDKGILVLKKIDECRKNLKGSEFEEFWDIFSASVDISVWGSDPWAPKILPNGAVLIRNHHRVIALDEQTSGSLYINNTELKEQLLSLKEYTLQDEEISNSEDPDFYFHYIHRNEDGFAWTTTCPEQLSDYGQTLIFISKNVIESAREKGDFDENHFIFNDDLLAAASNSRSGHCVIRVFKNVIFFYGTYRSSDEFDSIVENYSYYLGSSPDEDLSYNRVDTSGDFIAQFVKNSVEEQGEPDIFEDKFLKKNGFIKLLLKDRLLNGYSKEKAQQIQSFAPIFGVEPNIPSTYYGNDVPFIELAQKYDSRVFVLNGYLNFLSDVKNSKAELLEKFAQFSNAKNQSTLKVYLPIPGKQATEQSEDIFEYGTKEFTKRISDVSKELIKLYNEDQKENPSEAEEAEKDWLDSYGYDYAFSFIFITKNFPNVSDVHSYGLQMSGLIDNSLTMLIPSLGFFQGYSAGELDTGNINLFLSESDLESGESDEDEEYFDEDDE